MKKLFVIIGLISTIVLIMCSCGGKTTPVEDFTYERVSGEIVITGYTGTEFDIAIPAEIDDRPVTVIGEKAFSGYDLKTIVLPDTIERIEEEAFYECDLLEDVELPNGLSFIGYAAFDNCTSLDAITLPDDVMFDRRMSMALDGGHYIIWSPFDTNTVVYVSRDSETLYSLEENKEILDAHFSIMESFYINYVVE